ncbi:MFS general substrate transporter [Massarina eburnea CBS 473.64]|uniref:MFS general substrate transporter n=1 Tax=Massarina eburnea CBS 473.64 TaxID=1395130 RepID=A0A6A6S1R7_9PLEO|nr:MFS general substrate transporter [Massarina eburnea CBS 473.64]
MGKLLDAGFSRKIIGCGTILVPFGLFMLSIAHPDGANASGNFMSIWSTQGLVVGLGMATFFVASSQIAATWFPKHRALAVGVVACGASIAGVIYPTMLKYTIEALGFNNAVRIVAGLVALTSIFALFFATPNPNHFHAQPTNWLSVKTWIDPDAFRNKSFCWFTASIAFLFLGFYPVFFNLEEWAAVKGFGTRDGSRVPLRVNVVSSKPLQTFWLLTITNGASTFGRLFLAAFGDALGALNMHYMTTFICSILIYTLWTLADSLTVALCFCVFFGIFSGAVIGLPPASVANILECTYTEKDEQDQDIGKQKLGQWTGMMYSMASIPALCGPLIAGHLVSTYNTYLTVQLWSGTSLLLSTVCMLVARWYLPLRNGDHVRSVLPILRRNYRRDGNPQLLDPSSSSFVTSAASKNASSSALNEKVETVDPPARAHVGSENTV